VLLSGEEKKKTKKPISSMSSSTTVTGLRRREARDEAMACRASYCWRVEMDVPFKAASSTGLFVRSVRRGLPYEELQYCTSHDLGASKLVSMFQKGRRGLAARESRGRRVVAHGGGLGAIAAPIAWKE